jgi:hypothetical protein
MIRVPAICRMGSVFARAAWGAGAAWGVLVGVSLGCQPAASASPGAMRPGAVAAGSSGPSAPAPPRPSITGCVESPELKRYVLALDARRSEARQLALAALGATPEARTAAFASEGGPLGLDHRLDAGGKRWVVAAQVAPGFAPEAALARVGGVLHRVEERPRAHATPVLACGVQRCLPPRNALPAPLPVRSVLVELQPGERWGGGLALGYDYWWADVRYDRAEACAPAPTPAQPRAAAAYNATP